MKKKVSPFSKKKKEVNIKITTLWKLEQASVCYMDTALN